MVVDINQEIRKSKHQHYKQTVLAMITAKDLQTRMISRRKNKDLPKRARAPDIAMAKSKMVRFLEVFIFLLKKEFCLVLSIFLYSFSI